MKKIFPGTSPSGDIVAQFKRQNNNDNHSHPQLDKRDASPISRNFPENCPYCGSANLSTGAGLKPGQMSLKCSECRAFIGYKNLEKLERLKHRKRLTPCLELLESCGISGDAAIFVLGQVGGEG